MPAIGVVVIGHDGLPEALLAAARAIVTPARPARAVGVAADETPESARARIAAAIDAADSGGGVLLLVDLFGASPCNAARAAAAGRANVRLVAGASLGMLLRVYNYSNLGLAELAETAAVGGSRSIVQIEEPVGLRGS